MSAQPAISESLRQRLAEFSNSDKFKPPGDGRPPFPGSKRPPAPRRPFIPPPRDPPTRGIEGAATTLPQNMPRRPSRNTRKNSSDVCSPAATPETGASPECARRKLSVTESILDRYDIGEDDTIPRDLIAKREGYNEDTLKVERTSPQIPAATPLKKNDLERKVTLLATTLTSTEERFQDVKQRHEKELKQRDMQVEELTQKLRDMEVAMDNLVLKHEDEMEAKQFEVEQMQDKFADKERRYESQFVQLESTLESLERDGEERERVLQERVEFLQEQLQSAQGDADFVQLKAEIEELRLDKNLAEERARENAMQDMMDLEERLSAETERTQSSLSSFEALKQEHEALKASIEDRHLNAKAEWELEVKDMVATYEDTIQDLKRDCEHLQKSFKESQTALEQSETELSQIHVQLEQAISDRNQIQIELERLSQRPSSRRPSTTPMWNSSRKNSVDTEVRYVSNDDEVMAFIEDMTSKLEAYRMEVDRLNSDAAKQQQQTNASSFSFFRSTSTAASSDSESLRKDFEAILEREQRLQTEYDGLLQEYDRLSANHMDMESERRRMQEQMSDLRSEITRLQERFHAELEKNLGSGSEAPTAQRMRIEFRKHVQEIRTEYNELLQKEMEAHAEAEQALRDLRRERDLLAYSKRTQAAQTLDSFIQSN